MEHTTSFRRRPVAARRGGVFRAGSSRRQGRLRSPLLHHITVWRRERPRLSVPTRARLRYTCEVGRGTRIDRPVVMFAISTTRPPVSSNSTTSTMLRLRLLSPRSGFQKSINLLYRKWLRLILAAAYGAQRPQREFIEDAAFHAPHKERAEPAKGVAARPTAQHFLVRLSLPITSAV